MNAFATSSAHFGAPRGAAPVGQLPELPPVEQMAILYLRSWCAGGQARAQIAEDFTHFLGSEAGPAAAARFDALMAAFMQGARRPLMRHALSCRCFGGDESAFANLIGAATGGDRDEAMLFATVLLTGYAAFDVVRAAEELGGAFLTMARAAMLAARASHAAASGFRH